MVRGKSLTPDAGETYEMMLEREFTGEYGTYPDNVKPSDEYLSALAQYKEDRLSGRVSGIEDFNSLYGLK